MENFTPSNQNNINLGNINNYKENKTRPKREKVLKNQKGFEC